MLALKRVIQLGALVETDLGEGFVIGRSTSSICDPNYGVRLLDGSLCSSYGTPRFSKLKLVDNYPIDHPKIPAGLRNYIKTKMPKDG